MTKTTMSKPKTQPTADPNAESTRIRCEATAAALERLSQDNQAFLDSGEARAPKAVYHSIEDLLEVVAEDGHIQWHQKSWQFLGHVCSITKIVESEKANWRSFNRSVHLRLQHFAQKAIDEMPNLLDDSPIEDKVIELESIEDFVEQKVSDDQIARCYEWFLEDGSPDRKRAKSCRQGEVKAPTTKTILASYGGCPRQPHLGELDACLNFIEGEDRG